MIDRLKEFEAPDARWQSHEVGQIVTSLMDHFSTRDMKLALRDALIFRRKTNEQATGQYVPKPFDTSKSIIKHATGILVDRAEHLSAKASENSPNIKVNTIVKSGQGTARAFERARNQENALNAFYWEADRAYQGNMQHVVAFSQVTKGVGWYHSYENHMGWATPSRAFYAELTAEELERLSSADAITDVFKDAGKEFQYAESLSHFERRRLDAQRNAAENGETLFHVEVLAPGTVYYRKDLRGISLGMIVEEVPAFQVSQEFGVTEDEHGNVVIGADRGGATGASQAGVSTASTVLETWLRIRIWTRDEVYYYVSRQQGGRPAGAGKLVYWAKHDYGEVPLWPAAAYMTDSTLPDEEYIPLLEGAYAMVPGYNQAVTLLSNAAVFNLIPRYVIIRADGSPVMDPDTNQPLTFETDNVAGLDPRYAAIVETGGGEFRQLKIENVQDVLQLVEIYGRALDQTLPPEAAMGSSGAEEPAWGTRLKQAAANVKIGPVVKGHAAAVMGMARFWSRVVKHRGQEVVVYAKPEKRYSANGAPAEFRADITLKPAEVTMDVAVSQRSSDAQERIVKMQVGLQLRYPQAGTAAIDDIEFYEEWMESDDPIGSARRAMAQQVVDAVKPMMVQRIIQRVQARLTEPTPNEVEAQAQTQARLGRTDMLPAEPAAAAGIRSPGIEMSMDQPSLPPLGAPQVAR